MFARRPGRDNALPPICVGSHLDTQPTGGKFDGILGVLSGLEVLRTLNDAGYETNAPIEVINWTNEEGSRFAPAMLASGVFAGVFTEDYAYGREDRDGKRFGDELDRIGYRGPVHGRRSASSARISSCISSRGRSSRHEEKTIGVVTGVQGMRWYEVTVTGRESHAGTTPMRLRRDALRGAARMIEAVDRDRRRHRRMRSPRSAWSRSGRTAATSSRARSSSPSTAATPTMRSSGRWRRRCGRRSSGSRPS